MVIVHCSLGVDVGKDSVVVRREICGRWDSATFPNDEAGMERLRSWLGACSGRASLESSGGFERLCARCLESMGLQVSVHNPMKVRRLAEGLGFKAKTDAVDARVLQIASQIAPPAPLKGKVQERLTEISRAIEQFKKDRSDYLKRMRNPWVSPEVRLSMKNVVSAISEAMKTLDKEHKRLLRENKPLQEKAKLAMTVPSVGPVLARILVAELPENLEAYDSKQLCAYCGVAPYDDSSGRRNGKKHVRGGNRNIKAGLYMPALNAVKHQEWARLLYGRLRAKGKCHQEAIVAVMRRLLRMVIAVLKRGSAWQAEPICT